MKRRRGVRQKSVGDDSLRSDYNLRSNSCKRVKRDLKSGDHSLASGGNQLMNSQNCEDLSQRNVSTISQTSVTHKTTKMPNKSYNLRRRVTRSGSRGGRHVTEPLSLVTIDDLPDDCLLDIFERLDTIEDKCALQRVNKRFYSLVNRLLVAQKSFTVGSTFGPNNEQMLTQRICRTIISKCPNLQTFKMPGFYTKTSINSFDERIGDKEMYVLGKKCKDLKELDICGCGNVTEKGINFIAEICPKLEKLSISFCLQVSGASLQKLTKNFRTLSINTNDMTPPLVECLNSLSRGDGKFITELNVCAYNELDSQENILQMICKQFRSLQTLRYSIISKDLVKYGAFGQLTALTELVFDCTSLNLSDHELVKILEGCHQLKSIFIRYEHTKDHNTITDYSLRKLPKLCPHLVKFNFQAKDVSIQTVTDATIESFSSLKHLEFLGFRSFENIGDAVILVIKSCPKLNALYLYNCDNVSNATVDALIAAAKSQPNKRIKYDITSANLKKRKKKLPVNLIHCSKK